MGKLPELETRNFGEFLESFWAMSSSADHVRQSVDGLLSVDTERQNSLQPVPAGLKARLSGRRGSLNEADLAKTFLQGSQTSLLAAPLGDSSAALSGKTLETPPGFNNARRMSKSFSNLAGLKLKGFQNVRDICEAILVNISNCWAEGPWCECRRGRRGRAHTE